MPIKSRRSHSTGFVGQIKNKSLTLNHCYKWQYNLCGRIERVFALSTLNCGTMDRQACASSPKRNK
eukprot:scaffold111793_cov20-Prasinocladus_malaysianus.AAC.1